MKNQFNIQNSKLKIVVVGAGPAGTSLAIRLAKNGFDVTLIEREKFPRHKLCGEFISPECLEHFRELEVFDEMISEGGDRIAETVFYAENGKSVGVPSKWFNGDSKTALSLSRAEMDFQLLEKAKKVGVNVLEETQVIGVLFENSSEFREKVCGVKVRDKNGESCEILSDLTIDATGRARVLGKMAEKKISRKDAKGKRKKSIKNPKSKTQNRLVGFKAHVKNVRMKKGVCEIYFFRGGYGGLSFVENGVVNHCFLIKADIVKEFGGDANKIVENVVFKNKRACETLKDAEPVLDWLAVSVDGFGGKDLNPAPNLLMVGDASAFIDPFTGSGMLMAFESAEILAQVIIENKFANGKIAEVYGLRHKQKFQKRLRICSIMRRAAFVPTFAKLIINILSLSSKAREILARSTRKTVLKYENEK
jgi:flavin-dependent dehydrogenase